ncbi:16S rRNA (cytidine(1402)-2'-O)-methyltransferase [Lachnospiraceae bacterium MD1]|uniref:Ribosomal RNA small subunit methyltransferase I n=1 Tax=Variimorphobacter saccharofermentans TaxID=2755051 RepID=A0A839JVJ4_9FIRM|nr:16S rRNA (cytidine(1402)-2'-O)-methyltransferase [Variimorphobacter saccharofermentans]MBB2181297.1 16S rRNA (cytidine(1402)-2'-O)-methyltransferase [Variimorphobacter saccharofermentans]
MSGILYLCATPIGNLEDITFRVIKTLKEVDLIAAEDTRHSIKLLNHYEIKTPMTSYHEYNKVEKARNLVEQLREGKNIALITDAGTPGISDPGEELVRQAYLAGIQVTSLPGACAAITALTLSGLPTRRFCFEAFLPSDKRERQRILEELKLETRTIILYEAPHRLSKTLKELTQELGARRVAIIKELTKKHETIMQSTLSEATEYFEQQEPKGEYVLVVEGKSRKEVETEKQERWEEIDIREHMKIYQDQGKDKKEAMKLVAKDRGISKREVYQMLIQEEADEEY